MLPAEETPIPVTLHFAAGPATVHHVVIPTQTRLRDVTERDAKTLAISKKNPQQGACIAWHFPGLLGRKKKEKNPTNQNRPS